MCAIFARKWADVERHCRLWKGRHLRKHNVEIVLRILEEVPPLGSFFFKGFDLQAEFVEGFELKAKARIWP